MPVPPPGAIRGYPQRFAPYPVNQGPPALPPEKLDLKDRVIKQIEYYFRQVLFLHQVIYMFCASKTMFFAVHLGISCSISMRLDLAVFTLCVFIPFFSDENLQNDNYLISLMDEQGWVPIKIIADFKRVILVT